MFFKKIFISNNKLNLIQKSVDNHKQHVDELIENIKIGKTFKDNYIDVLLDISKYLDLSIWKKDKNHLYEFSNIKHCVDFLRLDKYCVKKIFGFSDLDLINGYMESTGNINTFSEICSETDEILKQSLIPCDFIESGIINKDEILLKVKKIPLFKNKKFDGSIGISQKIETLKNYKDKKIIYKDKINKNIFIYQIF